MSTTKQTRKYARLLTPVGETSLTKQSFKAECNINNIMAKFQKSGAITHYAAHAPTYGDCTPIELLDAQLIISHANEMFDDLPSAIRKRFHNNPEEFLEFVQNEDNQDEMVKLGLKAKPKAPVEKRSEKPPEATEKPETGKTETSTITETKPT